MRLVQFYRHGDGGGARVGVEQAEGQGVIDLKAFDPSMPCNMKEFLEMGEKGMECAQRYTLIHTFWHRKQNNTFSAYSSQSRLMWIGQDC